MWPWRNHMEQSDTRKTRTTWWTNRKERALWDRNTLNNKARWRSLGTKRRRNREKENITLKSIRMQLSFESNIFTGRNGGRSYKQRLQRHLLLGRETVIILSSTGFISMYHPQNPLFTERISVNSEMRGPSPFLRAVTIISSIVNVYIRHRKTF